MRLVFSTSDHLNTDISDQQGNVLYNVSTPSRENVTTITKYSGDGQGETMGSIEWSRSSNGGLFRFESRVIPVNAMFQRRAWSSGLYFVGPNQRTYKWKISSRCWMKPAGGNLELVRFHKKNLGALKPIHPAYLEVSSSVVSILDFIILTFVYAECKCQEIERRQNEASVTNANIARMNAINANIANMNAINANIANMNAIATLPPPPPAPAC